MSDSTTIAALATPPAPSGVAVIRVSGPRTRTAVKAIFRAKTQPVDNPRQVVYGHIVDFRNGKVIDQAIAFFMPGPNSFTGEDVAEFQFHGSLLLVQHILNSLFAFGITPAEPGEFTKRAFLNGKLDLVQAEAIADLIHASSERALKIASEHLKGRLSTAVAKIGEPLREVLAELEASIDFPEEDIEAESLANLQIVLKQTEDHLSGLLETYSYGSVIKEGFRVLLCGPPNAGKSSLLNLFLSRDRAIVSDVSGTTRDLIEEAAILDGYQLVFCDSAGLRTSDDKVEQIGIELARDRISWADLVLFIVDANDKDTNWQNILKDIKGKNSNIWLLVNKIDLNPKAIGEVNVDTKTCRQNFFLSALSGDGIESLKEAIVDEVAASISETPDSSNIVTNERHRACLRDAADAVSRAQTVIEEKQPVEIVSIEVRNALSALDEIVGKTYTENILGRIFSKFCIGK